MERIVTNVIYFIYICACVFVKYICVHELCFFCFYTDFFQSNDVISGCRSTDLNLHNYGVVMEDVVIEDVSKAESYIKSH